MSLKAELLGITPYECATVAERTLTLFVDEASPEPTNEEIADDATSNPYYVFGNLAIVIPQRGAERGIIEIETIQGIAHGAAAALISLQTIAQTRVAQGTRTADTDLHEEIITTPEEKLVNGVETALDKLEQDIMFPIEGQSKLTFGEYEGLDLLTDYLHTRAEERELFDSELHAPFYMGAILASLSLREVAEVQYFNDMFLLPNAVDLPPSYSQLRDLRDDTSGEG